MQSKHVDSLAGAVLATIPFAVRQDNTEEVSATAVFSFMFYLPDSPRLSNCTFFHEPVATRRRGRGVSPAYCGRPARAQTECRARGIISCGRPGYCVGCLAGGILRLVHRFHRCARRGHRRPRDSRFQPLDDAAALFQVGCGIHQTW